MHKTNWELTKNLGTKKCCKSDIENVHVAGPCNVGKNEQNAEKDRWLFLYSRKAWIAQNYKSIG